MRRPCECQCYLGDEPCFCWCHQPLRLFGEEDAPRDLPRLQPGRYKLRRGGELIILRVTSESIDGHREYLVEDDTGRSVNNQYHLINKIEYRQCWSLQMGMAI